MKKYITIYSSDSPKNPAWKEQKAITDLLEDLIIENSGKAYLITIEEAEQIEVSYF